MVTLVGAGPGDIGLITLKGMSALKNADVVLYDRLAGQEIISAIPESAEKIYVGKNANRHAVPQDEIERIMLEKARQGLNVVRLKGGDPFVFGRGGEELELLSENNIEFEVVPGISSSTAAGMYAGIPVTHRDFASSVHIITGHAKENGELDIDYTSLVRHGGTLVFMMSVATLEQICGGLLAAGMSRNMPAAIVENATESRQRKFLGTVSELARIAAENAVKSPAVIIVGKVCSLSDKLDWFSRKPLINTQVAVTRARTGESALTRRLKELGCGVLEIPAIRTEPELDGNEALEFAVSRLESYDWLVFTSGAGVDLFFDYLKNARIDIRGLHGVKIAAVGSETAKEIEKRGLFVDFIPKEFNGAALANGLVPRIKEGEKLLVARAKKGSEDILNILDEAGIAYDNIPLYDTVYEPIDDTVFMKSKTDCVTFTSSSTVEGFVKSFPDLDFSAVTGVCIGEKTAETAKEYGINTIVSEKATIVSLVEKIVEVYGNAK